MLDHDHDDQLDLWCSSVHASVFFCVHSEDALAERVFPNKVSADL